MNRNYNPLEDLANSGNRLIGKGVCVDCLKFSGKYKRTPDLRLRNLKINLKRTKKLT